MRSKLKLNLDQLSVDSFDTSAQQATRGTVHGEQCTCPTACTCPGCPTCDATCANTCDDYTCAASCNGTCGAATCGNSCRQTDCACFNTNCLNTGCGMYECCA
jgi:hypothetical protein